ncbi:FtsX-like permease family protein [Georgenia halophila]|uniref:FtsX-like permease family protein n=1 Tax=Georgenia halophila TaxID=620889 RepID=A0ABP8KTM4_9MICO
MIRLTLAQMRRSVGRLAAAGIAIAVATAFVTATLLAGNLITGTTNSAVTASLADADVILRPTGDPVGAQQVTELAELPQAGTAEGVVEIFGQVSAEGQRDAGLITPVPGTEELDPYELASGERPGPGEVALTESVAERLAAEPGDTVTVGVDLPDGEGGWNTQDRQLTLSGTIVDPPAIVAPVGTVLVDRALAEEWGAAMGGGQLSYDSVLITAASGVSPDALARSVSAEVPSALVRTAEEEAAAKTAELTGSTDMLIGLVLAFAAVAVFVAAIVIANTFQVLVAQRRHTLALLRCVGATRAQIRQSVLVEAVLLGLAASLGGIAAGLGLGQIALWFLGNADLGITIPSVIAPTVWTVLVPLVTGTAVTLLAALAPARAATSVAPVSALRPASDPGTRAAGGKLRRAIAIVLFVLGALLLVGAVVAVLTLSEPDSGSVTMLALAVGVLGGMLSFAGVLVGAVYLVPQLVRALGTAWARVAKRSRPTVQLATANSRRNPRRTSATASALLIGVALVTMMATGAGSARSSLNAALDSQFPVDIMVNSSGRQITRDQVQAVAEAEGVEDAVPVRSTTTTIEGGSSPTQTTVMWMDPADRDVLRDRDMLAGLTEDVVLLGQDVADDAGITDGGQVRLTGPAGAYTGTAVVLPDAGTTVVAPLSGLDDVEPDAPVTSVWARIAPDVAAGTTVLAVQDALAESSGTGTVPYAQGAAVERAAFTQVIDTLLAVVIGLLGVAVVIAVVGVANTLSLSVIERRHEHALLRAVGMTRGQLRGTLTVEGVLVALVGTGVGAVLGLLYGWGGAAIILTGTGDLQLVVPWPYLGTAALGAVLAGFVASVLPARSAAKTPPVAALAA